MRELFERCPPYYSISSGFRRPGSRWNSNRGHSAGYHEDAPASATPIRSTWTSKTGGLKTRSRQRWRLLPHQPEKLLLDIVDDPSITFAIWFWQPDKAVHELLQLLVPQSKHLLFVIELHPLTKEFGFTAGLIAFIDQTLSAVFDFHDRLDQKTTKTVSCAP